MKNLPRIFTVTLMFFVLAFSESSWSFFKDDDWTHSFFERCRSKGGFADGSKVNWIKEGDTKFLRFTLAGRQKGNCSREKNRRKNHSSVPHWERSEISSGPDSRNKFVLRSGGRYKINLRVRFLEGFVSDQESILQLYGECPWKGRCSPLLMLKSIINKKHGVYANQAPSFLRAYVLYKKGNTKKKQSNIRSASSLNDYRSKGYYFRDNSSGYFSHTIHKGKWINIIFIVSITPKKAILRSRVEANSRIYTVPEQTIDIPPGYPDPYIVLGLYRPGSDEIPNPTSTIDFDYIKISKMSDADFNKLNSLDYL